MEFIARCDADFQISRPVPSTLSLAVLQVYTTNQNGLIIGDISLNPQKEAETRPTVK